MIGQLRLPGHNRAGVPRISIVLVIGPIVSCRDITTMRHAVRMRLREANMRFSQAIRAGHEVVLTERGKPIAVMKPLQDDGQKDRPSYG